MTSDSPPVSCLPQHLGDERHDRVQQLEQRVQDSSKNCGGMRDTFCKLHFSELEVPVAELVPCEVVQRFACAAELVVVQRRIHLGANLFHPPQNPAIGIGQLGDIGQWCRAGAVHQREPGGVEKFGGEVARGAGVVLTDGQVTAWAGAAGQGEPQRVRTEGLDPVQRIDPVAARLAHLATELVADQPVQEHVSERHREPHVGRRW